MFESLGPVDNTTLRERVYRTLKQAILEGRVLWREMRLN